jgi:hypothetical protein
MKNLLTAFSIVLMITAFSQPLFAGEENRQSGVEVSTEHKSEQGAEHGKAYAGSKEKEDKEEKVEKDKKEKKEKKEK